MIKNISKALLFFWFNLFLIRPERKVMAIVFTGKRKISQMHTKKKKKEGHRSNENKERKVEGPDGASGLLPADASSSPLFQPEDSLMNF